MVVAIESQPSFTPGIPRLMFEGSYVATMRLGSPSQFTIGGPSSNYDVSAEGRFVMLQPNEASATNQIVVVLNWFEELKRLVPTEN